MGRVERERPWLGNLLVALQFLLLFVLAWSATAAVGRGSLPFDALALAGAGVLLGLWSLAANRPGNFNIRPVPRVGGELVRHGPYRWIRHPMYAALLLVGAAAARLAADSSSWLVFSALVVVLFVKSSVEERGLLARYPDYQAYRQGTHRFIPWLI